MSLEDALFYIALSSECYKAIYDKISWSQNTVAFSYQMAKKSDRIDWFKNQFKGWENFRKKSTEKLKDDFSYVIFTDITGFYENIDIQLLLSDLSNCNISEKIIGQLSKCLNKWASISKGIPQGQSASDLLAKCHIVGPPTSHQTGFRRANSTFSSIFAPDLDPDIFHSHRGALG